MRRKSLVLFAAAGLLVLALAGPRADSAIPAMRLAGQHQDLDSVRILPTKTKGVALPPAIDANNIIRQVRRVRESAPSPALDSSPFTDQEFMPAPTIFATLSSPGSQRNSSVAFDGTNYLVVWRDDRNGGDIYGARVSQSGSPMDTGGIAISTAASVQDSPAVAFDGTSYLVVWRDDRNGGGDIYAARVSMAGAVLDPNGIAISTAANSQNHPAVAFDGTNYLVVWQDDRNGNWDIYGARVSQSGSVLDSAGAAISDTTGHQQSPSVAFDGTNYLVVWQDDRDGGGDATDIYGARVSTAGVVEDPDGIAISTAMNLQWYPAVAFDGTNYLVVWADSRNVSGYPYWDVYGARVSQPGSVLDPGGIAVSTVTNSQNYPAVAFDGTNYLVVWQDNRDNDQDDIYGARVSVAGEVLDYPNGIVVGRDVNSQTQQTRTAVAFDGANYLVVWEDDRTDANRDIYGARVSMAGEVLDYPDGIVVACCANSQIQPAVAFDGANYLVVWQDDRNYGTAPNLDIYGARVSPSGSLFDPAGFAVCTAADSQVRPAVAFDGTNYLVVWQDLRNNNIGDIYGARVSTSGVVQDPDGIAISTATRFQWYPAVAFDGTNYLVVWADSRMFPGYPYWDVYGARVRQSGSVLDPNGIAITAGWNSENIPAVAFDGTNYLVVWQDNRDNDTGDIYGARVSTSGVVQDPDGIAISTATDNQLQPAVAFDGANYLVAWHDIRGGSTYDIYSARVTPAGVVLDTEGIVISTAADDQNHPALAFDGVDFFIVWEDGRSGDSTDIYGARVTPAGTVYDERPVVWQEGCQFYPALARGAGNQMFLVYQGWTGSVDGKTYNTDRIWGTMNPSSAIAEMTKSEIRMTKLPTIVRGVLFLPEASSHKPQASSLQDVSGRTVLDLHPGANDVRSLPPGVYFVRVAQAQAQAVHRVVFAR